MNRRMMSGLGAGGGLGGGTVLFLAFGAWGLVALIVVTVAWALATHLPELAQLLDVVYRHRDGRWLLDDDARTNRRIALHNHVPLPERGEAQQVPAPELEPPGAARRPRPRPDP